MTAGGALPALWQVCGNLLLPSSAALSRSVLRLCQLAVLQQRAGLRSSWWLHEREYFLVGTKYL